MNGGVEERDSNARYREASGGAERYPALSTIGRLQHAQDSGVGDERDGEPTIVRDSEARRVEYGQVVGPWH
jgi:hypothetical protein